MDAPEENLPAGVNLDLGIRKAGNKPCSRASAGAPDQQIVFAMVPDPEPDDLLSILHGQRSVVDPHPHGPHPPELFEMQRRMPGVVLEQFVIGIGKRLDFFGEPLVELSKLGVRTVPHSSAQRPACKSRRASSASASS